MAPLAAVGAVIGIVGAAAKIGGNIMDADAAAQKANATNAAYQHNADVKEQQADEVVKETDFNVTKMNVMNRRDIGQQVATYGAAGVDKSGSALDVLAESTAQAHADALNTQQKGDYQAAALRSDAAYERSAGTQIAQAGQPNVGRIILGSAAAGAGAFPSVIKGFGPNNSGGNDEE